MDSDWTPQFLIMWVQRWKASCILWYCKYINFFPVSISPSLPFCFCVSPLLWCISFLLSACLSSFIPFSLSLSLSLSGWSGAHLVKTGLIDYRIIEAIKLVQSSMPSLFSLPPALSPSKKKYILKPTGYFWDPAKSLSLMLNTCQQFIITYS